MELCDGCIWNERGDEYVGLDSGCTHENLYDMDDRLIGQMLDQVIEYMRVGKCPWKEVSK